MYVSEDTRKAYAEIDNFIELLQEDDRNKIPKKLIKFFKEEKDTSYTKKININIPIKQQNLKEETLALIALLNLKYICQNEEEKNRLRKIYQSNEEKYQEMLKEKCNPDNIFKNSKKYNKNEIEEVQKENLPVEIKKENVFQKVINFMKRIFHL